MGKVIEVLGVGKLELDDDWVTSYNVMVLDDDEERIEQIEENLDSREDVANTHFEKAISAEQARALLGSRSFDAVVADVKLSEIDDSSCMRGDEWLLQNSSRFDFKAIQTGYDELIGDKELLRKNDVAIYLKGRACDESGGTFDVKLCDDISSLAIAKEKSKIREITESLREMFLYPFKKHNIADEANAMFIDWLMTRQTPESPSVFLMGRYWSTAELANEISKDSEVGKKLMQMFLRHMRRRMKLELR